MENKVKKVTKAQRNLDIIALLQSQPVKYGTTVEDAVKHLRHENDLLAKKNTTTGKKKLTKAQEANEKYKGVILAYLKSNPKLVVTATDVMEKVLRPTYPDELWSNQKAASLLNAMSDKYDKDNGELISEGKLDRVEGKGKNKTTFQIKPEYAAEVEDEADSAE